MIEPTCKECGKQIWAIADMKFKLGVEIPALLHAVCFERLKEIEFRMKGLDK